MKNPVKNRIKYDWKIIGTDNSKEKESCLRDMQGGTYVKNKNRS